MPSVRAPEDLRGMSGHMAYRPAFILLNILEHVLLHSSEGISPGERVLVAPYVSSLNDCFYCQTARGSAAAAHMDGNEGLVRNFKSDYKAAPNSEKLKAILAIAALVRNGGKSITVDAVERARREGATDLAILDAILIDAAFCMYNRHMDGLDAWARGDFEFYRNRGADGAHNGYTEARLEVGKPVPKRCRRGG